MALTRIRRPAIQAARASFQAPATPSAIAGGPASAYGDPNLLSSFTGPTGPSGLYGVGEATGSPSAFYGMGGPTSLGGAGGAGASRGALSALGQVISGLGARVGGTIGGVPMVKTQQNPDPFHALTDAELQARAHLDVKAQYDPLIAEIQRAFEARSASGSAAIKGISEALAGHLANYQGSARDIYSQAQQQQAATDASLSGYLNNQALTGAGALSDRLGSINAPAVGQAAAAVQSTGQGGAGALLGKGSASLSQLIAQGAAAQDYAAKWPGIASSYGLQKLGDFQGQLTQDEASQLGTLRAQMPGTISSELSSLRDTELSKAQERERIREFGLTRADRLATATTKTPRISGTDTSSKYTITYNPDGSIRSRIPNPNYAPKAGAAARPFTIHPGDTVEVPNGKGGYTAYTAPPRPQAAKAPTTRNSSIGLLQWVPERNAWVKIPGTEPSTAKGFTLGTGQQRYDAQGNLIASGPTAVSKPLVVGSTQTGWRIVDPESFKTLATMAGTGVKPTITGSASTGWTARDANGNTVWTQAGAPKAAPSITSTQAKTLYFAGNAGGWDAKTGKLDPAYRKRLSDATGVDLPETITPAQWKGMWSDLGVSGSPKAGKPKITGTSPTSKWTIEYNPDGSVKSRTPNPNYVQPGSKVRQLTPAQRAKFDGQAETFASVAWHGGTDKDGKPLPPLSYTEAVAEAKKLGIPAEIVMKHLHDWYQHGNKEIQDFLSQPGLEFTMTGDKNVAALKGHKVVRMFKPGNPGYNIARSRALG